jgi:hypothetical protein
LKKELAEYKASVKKWEQKDEMEESINDDIKKIRIKIDQINGLIIDLKSLKKRRKETKIDEDILKELRTRKRNLIMRKRNLELKLKHYKSKIIRKDKKSGEEEIYYYDDLDGIPRVDADWFFKNWRYDSRNEDVKNAKKSVLNEKKDQKETKKFKPYLKDPFLKFTFETLGDYYPFNCFVISLPLFHSISMICYLLKDQ